MQNFYSAFLSDVHAVDADFVHFEAQDHFRAWAFAENEVPVGFAQVEEILLKLFIRAFDRGCQGQNDFLFYGGRPA